MVFTTSDQGITASTAPDSIAAVAKTPREPAEDATTSWRASTWPSGSARMRATRASHASQSDA